MSAASGIERSCVMYKFTLASVYNVNRIPIADAKEISHVCGQVINKIVNIVIKTVSGQILADDALVVVTAAISDNGLAKHGCIKLHCEST